MYTLILTYIVGLTMNLMNETHNYVRGGKFLDIPRV